MTAAAPLPMLGEFLWTEAGLLEDLAAVIERHQMDATAAAAYLREQAVTVRTASTDATAGRWLDR